MKKIFILLSSIIVLLLSSCNFFQKANKKSIFIGPDTQPCNAGVMETECMQIKWTKDQSEWEHFFGQIEGFNFERGYEYNLVVLEEKIKNPPADAPSVKYKLVKELSKRKVELSTYSDNSKNSLDWAGTYIGTLPCANCEGIKTTLSLFADGTFKRTIEYLGKKGETFSDEGKFEWNKEGSVISLIDNSGNQKYKVGENQLFHLDNNGNQIKGNLSENYILAKTINETVSDNMSFEDKKWQLVSFMGKEIKQNKSDFYIIFDSKGKKLNTKVGCNVMNAGYDLNIELRLKIKPLMSSMMACPENSIEDEYISNLKTVDNVTTNGELLHLNRARMTIATFKLEE